MVNLTATGTSEIAAKKGFEHQHQRVVPPPTQLLTDHMTCHTILLNERDRYCRLLTLRAITMQFLRGHNDSGKRKRIVSRSPSISLTLLAPYVRNLSKTF